MLDNIKISNRQIAFGDDFSLIFDCKLETNGKNLALKKKSLAKLIQINESLNLSDLENTKPPKKNFKHFIRIRVLDSFKER